MARAVRHNLVDAAADEWERSLSHRELDVRLGWESESWGIRVGTLRQPHLLFRYDPTLLVRDGDAWIPLEGDPPSWFAEDPQKGERLHRLLGKALCRAAWHRPRLDPHSLRILSEIREDQDARVEFLCETSALSDGTAHYLTLLMADRADLVLTDVSLRELQDKYEACKFGRPLLNAKDQRSLQDQLRSSKGELAERMETRSHYLGARRFHEFPGLRRVLWRELQLEVTSLLLSRGQGENKTSESDTAILRSVRRAVQERVRRLDRFFVVSDAALARRAATELPEDSVITGVVPDLKPGNIYAPCDWWPGPDQGRALGASSSLRLVWELLALCDFVALVDPKEQEQPLASISAFDREMWPSDYTRPWLKFTLPDRAPTTSHPPPDLALSEAPDPIGEEPLVPESSSPWQPGSIEYRPRFGARKLLDVLDIVRKGGDLVDMSKPLEGLSDEKADKYLRMLQCLDLVEGGSGPLRTPGRNQPALARLWRDGDVEQLHRMLLAFVPYRNLLLESPPVHAKDLRTSDSAFLALARTLGQASYLEGTWEWGDGNPELSAVREALLTQVSAFGPGRNVTMLAFFIEVMLRRERVAPGRVIRLWDRLAAGGVFQGFEFRSGGTSTGRWLEEVLEIGDFGWRIVDVDLEEFRGARDILYLGVGHA